MREPEKGMYTLPEGVPSRQLLDAAASRYDVKRIADRRRLDTMIAYVRQGTCREKQIRNYFGEVGPEIVDCGRCDICAGIPEDELAEPSRSRCSRCGAPRKRPSASASGASRRRAWRRKPARRASARRRPTRSR